MKAQIIHKDTVVADPPLARLLFSDRRLAPLWFIVRMYVGFSWLDAGWHKVIDTGAKTNYIIDGAGIYAFWQRIAATPVAPAKPVITYDWYSTTSASTGTFCRSSVRRGAAPAIRRQSQRDRS